MLAIVIVVVICILIFYFVFKANNKYWEKQKILWEPHCNAVNGKAVKQYKWSGEYKGIPVYWRVYSSGGGGGENSSVEYHYFEIYLQFQVGGKKWKLYYNVPSLLNHRLEGWTIQAKDGGLEDALTQAGIKDLATTLPRHFSVRYNNKNGRLISEFQVNGMAYVQPIDEFVSLLQILERMGKINSQLKSAS